MEGWVGAEEWLGSRWSVTISFIFILSLNCGTPISAAEVWKLKNIRNRLLKI